MHKRRKAVFITNTPPALPTKENAGGKNQPKCYVNKKVANRMFGEMVFSLFPISENTDGYIGSIAYNGDNVNTCGKGFSPFFAPLRQNKGKAARPVWTGCFAYVSTYLSSRAASSQVLSAWMSLTSVFGMGTGVPSSPSALTFPQGRPLRTE